MKARTIVVGILAVVFGVSCAVGVKAFLDAQAARPPKVVVEKAETKTVLSAKRTIPHGKTITADDVQVQEWPASMVSKGIVDTLEDVVNHAALVTIYEGDVILKVKLATGPTHDLASHLAPGMRAFTIHTPTIGSGVAGFILPGNKVDVLLTVTDLPSLKESGAMTVTILQGVEILAVDQETEAPASSKIDPGQMHSVTLAVTGSQASKLALAGSKGTLNLALRNATDQIEEPTDPVTLSDLQYLKDQVNANGNTEKPAPEVPVSLATHLAAGMRAFTIKATLSSGVAGLVLPRDRVDVLLTITEQRGASDATEAVTVSLMQDIEILAVDQLLDAPAANKTEPKSQYVVTLAVSPVQAATLALAETKGALSLSLRSPNDNNTGDPAARVTIADLKLPERTTPVTHNVQKVNPQTPELRIRTLRGTQNGVTTVYPMNETERSVGSTPGR